MSIQSREVGVIKDYMIACAAALFFFNVGAFAAMGIDKRLALTGKWRVRERTLWLWALPFSAAGAWLGMRVFHHKTHNPAFAAGIPALMALQALLLAFLIIYKFA